jgi:hypothetical protein
MNINNIINFVGNLNLSELVKEFQVYITTLSVQELAIVINLSGIIFILGCLSSIIFSF